MLGRGDDTYDAFVELYCDNSEVTSELIVCLPKRAR